MQVIMIADLGGDGSKERARAKHSHASHFVPNFQADSFAAAIRIDKAFERHENQPHQGPAILKRLSHSHSLNLLHRIKSSAIVQQYRYQIYQSPLHHSFK